MSNHPKPKHKRETWTLHQMLGAFDATPEERRLTFLAYRIYGYADALRYVEELKHGRPGNRPTLDAQI
jgi:hypothetical protein